MAKPKGKKHEQPAKATPNRGVTTSRDRTVATSTAVATPPILADAPKTQAAAKPQMAPRKAPVASPRPESIGMGSTSPSKVGASVPVPIAKSRRDPLTPGPHPTALPPATGPLSAFAQAQVMWYHHPDNYWVMGLVWTEHENLPLDVIRNKTGLTVAPAVRMLKAYHMLHRGQSGGIDYLKIPPKDEPHFDPTRATTTRAAFETYLADTLRKHGGARDAYKILGVAPPVATPIAVAPDGAPKPVKVEHEEMYERAARLLAVPVADLKAKYGHLNNGMQQMNLRNRLRAKGHNV